MFYVSKHTAWVPRISNIRKKVIKVILKSLNIADCNKISQLATNYNIHIIIFIFLFKSPNSVYYL